MFMLNNFQELRPIVRKLQYLNKSKLNLTKKSKILGDIYLFIYYKEIPKIFNPLNASVALI